MLKVRLSRNFTLDELKCKCGNCETTVDQINPVLVQKLQKLRDSFKLPIKIASGYRCEAHNNAIGGAKNSQHLFGRAADLDLRGYNGHDLHRLIRLIYASGSFSGVGIGGGRLHVDVRDSVQDISWMY